MTEVMQWYIDWQNGKASHEDIAKLFSVFVAASLAHRSQESEAKPHVVN